MQIQPRIFIGVEDFSLTSNDIKRLENKFVVGVILFKRNFQNLNQLQKLSEEIKKVNPNLLISVDQEGGRVQRFTGNGFHTLPELYSLRNASVESIQKHARNLVQDIKKAGVDFSFIPVVDKYDKKSTVIGARAFSQEFDEIIRISQIYIKELHKNKMPSILKHFPGHGSVVADTHTANVIDNREFEDILDTDIRPFYKLISENLADSVMVSHIIYPKLDNKSVSTSKFWINDVLRKQFGFERLIFSDDAGMFAFSHNSHETQKQNCDMFFQVGGDIVLLCNDFEFIDFFLNSYTDEKFIYCDIDIRLNNFKKRMAK